MYTPSPLRELAGCSLRLRFQRAPAQSLNSLETTLNIIVTGSSGLIGSEAVRYFDEAGHRIHGIDNNMRKEFFGPQGDTSWNLSRLKEITRGFVHHDIDIRDRESVIGAFREIRPDMVIH